MSDTKKELYLIVGDNIDVIKSTFVKLGVNTYKDLIESITPFCFESEYAPHWGGKTLDLNYIKWRDYILDESDSQENYFYLDLSTTSNQFHLENPIPLTLIYSDTLIRHILPLGYIFGYILAIKDMDNYNVWKCRNLQENLCKEFPPDLSIYGEPEIVYVKDSTLNVYPFNVSPEIQNRANVIVDTLNDIQVYMEDNNISIRQLANLIKISPRKLKHLLNPMNFGKVRLTMLSDICFHLDIKLSVSLSTRL